MKDYFISGLKIFGLVAGTMFLVAFAFGSLALIFKLMDYLYAL